jgi:hypothetical protein
MISSDRNWNTTRRRRWVGEVERGHMLALRLLARALPWLLVLTLIGWLAGDSGSCRSRRISAHSPLSRE